MASLRYRRQVAEPEDYDDDHDNGSRSSGTGTAANSATEEEAEEEEEEEDDSSGLHSMTAKGIQHLCSELLEINKASEQDFRANVHLSYLSFLRMFQEAGDLEKDVHRLLRRHVMAHRRLVQHVTDNLCSSSVLLLGGMAQSSDGSDMDVDAIPVAATAAHGAELELELDVLLSEHRMDEALQLLEQQGEALQLRMVNGGGMDVDDDGEAAAIASSMCALSAGKARVADRLASVAGHPRTPRAELLAALSGLCRLGDAQRANHLLFASYRSLVVRRAEELRCSPPPPPPSHHRSSNSSNYITELARIVFSAILHASRAFVALHGHPSPHGPELVRWAREEMEDFAAAFSEYVRSMSQVEVAQSLALAMEAAKCAVSYSSMLRPLGVVTEQDLIDLIVPCMQEAMTMYAKHLKEVIRLFVASDAWVLGRFLVSGILRARSPAGMLQIQHCLLTASGRKFVTLIQEVVEDVYPLLNLGMKNSVLQLLAELFSEYMHSIVEIIPRKEAAFQNECKETCTKDEKYTWQISILINCTTLVSLFPIIAHGVFKSDRGSGGAALPNSVADSSTQRELESLILLIKEAAGQVWACFCQQFIRDTMTKSSASLLGAGTIPSSSQGMMPSFAFQVLFRRVRQLNNMYGSILTGKDGTMKKLLQELMEAMIFWLSNNLDSWIHHPRETLLQQIQLDVHFLLEFAQLGGFSSESIRTSALDLVRKAEETVASLEHDSMTNSGGIREEGWATDAAKHAVEVLMGAEEICRSGTHEEANDENVVDAEELENVDVEGKGEGEEMDWQSDDHDCSYASSGHGDMVDDTSCVSVVEAAEDHETGGCDGGKSSDEFVSIEDDDVGAIEGVTEDGKSPEKLRLGLGVSQAVVPDSSERIGEEEKVVSEHPEPEVSRDEIGVEDAHGDHQGAADGNAQADHESGLGGGGSESPAGACHDSIGDGAAPCQPSRCGDDMPSPQEEAEVAGDDGDESGCSFTTSSESELVLQQPMPAAREAMAGSPSRRRRQGTATRAAAAAERGAPTSRMAREAVGRSSKPRWQ